MQITPDNINTISTNKNVLIFLVDAVDSKLFSETFEGTNEYQNTFKDFIYYPDTLAGYNFTKKSVPLILTGEWDENRVHFKEFSTRAFTNSRLLNKLELEDYSINLYEKDLVWFDDSVKKVSNVKEGDSYDLQGLLSQEWRYSLFRILPFFMKSIASAETIDFDSIRTNTFSWFDVDYKEVVSKDLEKIDQNYFQFIHLDGAHAPLNIDENFQPIKENDSKENLIQKMKASFKLIKMYIDRLKVNNVYDNSAIIIMSDHGSQARGADGKQNPILYIKGIEETHSKLKESDKPITYADMMDTIIDLSDGKKNDEIFINAEKRKKRRFIYYLTPSNMTEYETAGKAWDETSLKKTGKKYKY